MSTPINLVFKKGHDYLFAYCNHDGNSICKNLKKASYSDLEFIYNEINSRKNLEHSYIDSIYGTIGDKDAETEGVVSFHSAKSIENAIVRFRADNGLIKKSIREIVKFIEHTQDIDLFDCGWWTVWVDFDAEMVAGGDDCDLVPTFKPMKKKDFYTRSDSTYYDPRRGSEYEDHFTKMGMRGVEMDNDSGYDGMEESMEFSKAKQILKENGYRVINEDYETDVEGTLHEQKLLSLLSKLKGKGFDIDCVATISENKNDNSAEYDVYFSKSGVGFKLNLDIYEGKHTSYSIKDTDTEELIESGEGKSFMSAISTIDFAGLATDESTQIDEALEGPATSKQLWTLFKLTKKDYRGQDLSKEDAFKMIGDLLKNKENGSAEKKEELKKTPKKPKAAKPGINDNPLVKVGDIFSFSFGYDMTINQYYKVLSTKGKRAQVVEIGKKWVSGTPGYTGEVVPNPDKELEEPITALIRDDGTIRVKMYSRYHTAYRDDGRPSYENHMD